MYQFKLNLSLNNLSKAFQANSLLRVSLVIRITKDTNNLFFYPNYLPAHVVELNNKAYIEILLLSVYCMYTWEDMKKAEQTD